MFLYTNEDFVDSGSEYIPDGNTSTDSSILTPNYSPITPRIPNIQRTEAARKAESATPEREPHGRILSTPVSRKRARTDIRKGPGRKRLIQSKYWKIQKTKAAYRTGTEHENARGEIVKARKMGTGCKDTCWLRCQHNISVEYRKELFNRFWAIGDINLQREHLLRKIKSTSKRTTKIEKKFDRMGNKHYFLPKPQNYENENIRVCKTTFMDTFGINRQWIVTIFAKLDEHDTLTGDMRGKHHRKITNVQDRTIQSVKEHINLFPRIESHYLRKNTEREYLVGDLNISAMHRLYIQWVKQQNQGVIAASQRQYRDIFINSFNISFFVPKKDRCNDCTSYTNQNFNKEEGIYALHLNEAKQARQLKDEDKKSAIESHGRILAVVFDFEKILTCPNAEISTFYYKRNFNSYNFTVYSMNTKEAFCYVWHECIGKREPNEVVSCLYKFIQSEVRKNNHLEEIRFWSDNCFSQNKNKILISFYAWATNKFKIKITQRYLTKGHTQNEGDSVHSTIEKRKKLRDVMVPQEWFEIIRFAKISEPFYKVIEMTQSDFLNFKPLSEIANFGQSNFYISKLKEFQVSNSNLNISYKMDWNENQQQMELVKESKCRGRKAAKNPDVFKGFVPNPSYDKPLPISSAKWKDLKSLCDSNLIDKKYHAFYENLPFMEVMPTNEEDE